MEDRNKILKVLEDFQRSKTVLPDRFNINPTITAPINNVKVPTLSTSKSAAMIENINRTTASEILETKTQEEKNRGVASLYPDLRNTVTPEEKKTNEQLFELNAKRKYSNIKFFYTFEPTYNDEQINYRNDFLFNPNATRLLMNNISLNLDPLIYDSVTENKYMWPSDIDFIYYTNNTYDGKYVQVSIPVNLYLNRCFKKQNFSTLYRVGYYAIYTLMSLKSDIIDTNYVKNFFDTEENIAIRSDGFVETFYRDEGIIRNDNGDIRDFVRVPVGEKQLSNYRYKNLFDYIPICHIPPKFSFFSPINYEYYDKLDTIIMSNICHHKNNCHDYNCGQHNLNKNISRFDYHTYHFHEEPYHRFDRKQLIDISFLSTTH